MVRVELAAMSVLLSNESNVIHPLKTETVSMNSKRLLAAILFVSITSLASAQDDSYQTSQSEICSLSSWNDPCPPVYAHVGALFLQRTPQFSNQPIVTDPTANSTLLSTSDLQFGIDPGLQATVGMRMNGGRTIELDYFGLYQGTASAAALAPDPNAFLTFPDNLAGNVFVDMDEVFANYSSSVQSVAVNLLSCFGSCNATCDGCDSCDGYGSGSASCRSVSWFAGFRYLNVGERLDLQAQRNDINGLETGSYNIRTSNNLYGAQVGSRIRRTQGRFGWDGTGFGGIFGNDAQQTQSVTDFPNFALRPTVSSSQGGAAFVGGGNLSGLYQFNNVWNLRVGYNVMLIEGLALAPDQLDYDFAAAQGGTQLNNDGGMFLHGANIGLAANW